MVPVASAYADAPANDAFAAAIALTAENSPLTGTTVGSTAEPDEPWHVGAPARHSVWFTYANPGDETREVVVDTCGSSYDTLLAVYEGDALGTLHRLASNDDSCAGNGSRVSFDAEPGETYRIALDGYGGRTGAYTLRLDAPLANDARADAADLWQEQPARGTTVGATAEPGEAGHAGAPAEHSVWFDTYANAGEPVVIETCGSSFATRLAVYAGDGDEVLAQSAEQSCAGGRQGTVLRFTPEPGQEGMHVALDGVGGAAGAYRIGIWTGDDRARPYGIYDGLRMTYSNVGATREAGEPQHAGDPGGGSVWFEFSGRDGRRVVVDTCGTRLGGLDTVLAAYSEGEDGALLPVASSDDELGCGPGGTGSRLSFIAPAGRLLLAVDGKAGATGEFVLSAGVSPANDDVANAQGLPQRVEDWWASNALATAEDGEPEHGGAPAAHSVWFRWTPNTAGSAAVEVCGDGFKAVGAVYTRGEEGLTPVASEAEDSRCPVRGTGTSFQTEAGTEYLIAVDGADAGSGDFALSITRPAGNDAVADATALGGYLEGATFGATAEEGEPAHAGVPAQRSVWYRFEAGSQTRAFSVRLCPYSASARVAVYRGTSVSDLAPVASTGPSSNCTRVRVPLAVRRRPLVPDRRRLRPADGLLPLPRGGAAAPQRQPRRRAGDLRGLPLHGDQRRGDPRARRARPRRRGRDDLALVPLDGVAGRPRADRHVRARRPVRRRRRARGLHADGRHARARRYAHATRPAATPATRRGSTSTRRTARRTGSPSTRKPGGDPQYSLRAAWTPYNDNRADARRHRRELGRRTTSTSRRARPASPSTRASPARGRSGTAGRRGPTGRSRSTPARPRAGPTRSSPSTATPARASRRSPRATTPTAAARAAAARASPSSRRPAPST